MNKKELIEAVSEKAGMTQTDVQKAVDALTDVIADALKEGTRVQLTGFGIFEQRIRSARKGRNPKTNEEIDIPEKKVPAFKASMPLKRHVNA